VSGVLNGDAVATSSTTVSDYLNRWLTHITPTRFPTTIRGYRFKTSGRLVRPDRLAVFPAVEIAAARGHLDLAARLYGRFRENERVVRANTPPHFDAISAAGAAAGARAVARQSGRDRGGGVPPEVAADIENR
jgi:hypothetical protein